MIDDDEAGAEPFRERVDLVDLAGAKQRTRSRVRYRDEQCLDHLQIDGLGKARGFDQAIRGRMMAYA